MALLAEELVQEWLNRQGFFSIRGLKIGVDEIDLLAVRPRAGGGFECRHVEVQVSHNPVSYMCVLPRDLQKSTDTKANSAKKRVPEHVKASVEAWIHKKFKSDKKTALKAKLCPGKEWTTELVINHVKFQEELAAIVAAGVKVTRFSAVLDELRKEPELGFTAAAGDFTNLVLLSPHRAEGTQSKDGA